MPLDAHLSLCYITAWRAFIDVWTQNAVSNMYCSKLIEPILSLRRKRPDANVTEALKVALSTISFCKVCLVGHPSLFPSLCLGATFFLFACLAWRLLTFWRRCGHCGCGWLGDEGKMGIVHPCPLFRCWNARYVEWATTFSTTTVAGVNHFLCPLRHSPCFVLKFHFLLI